MSSRQPPSRRTADAAQTRDELERLRPGLIARYDAALPGARASVLARLLGAVAREPLPGLAGRGPGAAWFAAPGDGPAGDGGQHDTAGRRYEGRRAGEAGSEANYSLAGGRADNMRETTGGPSAIELNFPAAAAVAFAQAEAGLAVTVRNGTRSHNGTRRHNGTHGQDETHGHIETHGANRTSGHDETRGHNEPHGHNGSHSHNETHGQNRTRGHDEPRGSGLDDPGTLVRLLWGDVPLAAEVDNSVANLALARAAQPPETLPTDLGRIEQLVVDGHPLHPCCRTRGGMTVDDVLTYAPEHSPVIRLRRLRVPENRWFGTAPPLLYAHPWQADHLKDRYPWLTDDGETGPGRPLMSLRTIALRDRHVKTAIDVQMTSAVRTVSPAAVANGPRLSALLEKLTADLPISVLAETAGGAVIVDGEPQRHLAYLARQAPQIEPGELVVPLAAMTEPLLLATVRDPYEWWGLLSDRLFAPLVTVLDRGVALEAHGQNTLVVLKDRRPHRILYRDFGGVRVSARRLNHNNGEVPPLDGDLPSDDPRELRTKVAASALGNAAADLIAAFTRHFGTDPARLWRQTAIAIRGTGTGDVAHLLRDPLPIKATTAMRLATEPLDDLWAYLDNPLAAA